MIYGERIRQAREYCGLTQLGLAKGIGVNQSSIAHIENGRNVPSMEILKLISERTGFLPSFFEKEPTVDFPLGSLVFRARSSLSAREFNQAHQHARVLFEQVKEMSGKLNIPSVRLPVTPEDPSKAARVTRVNLGLSPDLPIKNLIKTIEKKGVLVLVIPIVLKKIDAFSTWVDLESETPLIVISAGKPTDRLRFSVAHELGHLVMHQVHKGWFSQLEKDADKFAADFLLPGTAMKQVLVSPITLTSVARLKLRWGVSMQALIRRARDLDLITNRQYRYLFEQLSARGWRKREPSNLDLPEEKPQLVAKMIEEVYGSSNPLKEYATDMSLSFDRAIELTRGHISQKITLEPYRVSPEEMLKYSRN